MAKGKSQQLIHTAPKPLLSQVTLLQCNQPSSLKLNIYVYAILKSFYEFEVNNLGQF